MCADALLGPEPGGRETAGAEAQETPSPPIRRSRRPWTFQDLKRAHRMHGSAKVRPRASSWVRRGAAPRRREALTTGGTPRPRRRTRTTR